MIKPHLFLSFMLVLLAFMFVGCSSSNPEYKVSYVPVKVSSEKWSFVDNKGNVVCVDQFDNRPSLVYNGYFSFHNDEGKSLCEIRGENFVKIPSLSNLEYLGYVEDGLVPATKKGYRISIYDTSGALKFELQPVNGKEIIKCAPGYSDGLLQIVDKDDNIGFIDTSGKVVINPKYNKATVFNEGIALVRRENNNGDYVNEAIDKDGKVIFSLRSGQYPKGHFNDGYLIVEDGNRDVLYDSEGEIYRFPVIVNRIKDVNSKYIIFRNDDSNYGVADLKGNIIIDPEYSDIQFISSRSFLAKAEDNYLIINSRGEIKETLYYSNVEQFGRFGFFVNELNDRYILVDEHQKQKGKEDFYSYYIDFQTDFVYSDYHEEELEPTESMEATEVLPEEYAYTDPEDYEPSYTIYEEPVYAPADAPADAPPAETPSPLSSIRYFSGEVGNQQKYKVHMKLNLSKGEGIYYYDKHGPTKLLSLSFTPNPHLPDSVEITEYNKKGMVSGVWHGYLDSKGYTGEGVFHDKWLSFTLRNCTKEEARI